MPLEAESQPTPSIHPPERYFTMAEQRAMVARLDRTERALAVARTIINELANICDPEWAKLYYEDTTPAEQLDTVVREALRGLTQTYVRDTADDAK